MASISIHLSPDAPDRGIPDANTVSPLLSPPSPALFSGGLDGHPRAYSTVDGKIPWDLDTATDEAHDGIKAL